MFKPMSNLVILLLLCSTRALGQAHGSFKIPEECKRVECAPYKVLKTTKDLEIRSYTPAIWIATYPIRSSSYLDAIDKGFMTLFGYIEGSNEMKKKMNMTAPVMVDVAFDKTGRAASFVVHFYLEKEYQSKAPASERAQLVKLPKHRFAAVRRFGGFMNDTNIPSQALALRKSIQRYGLSSPAHGFSVAGYDGPDVVTNRVNEIIMWFDHM